MSGFDGAVLPLLIFVAEMFVVTVCTVRIISLSRGMKYTAAAPGAGGDHGLAVRHRPGHEEPQ